MEADERYQLKTRSTVVFVFLLFSSSWCLAVETSYSNSFWFTGYHQTVRSTDANSSNQVLRLPELAGRFDWRPEFKLSNESTRIVVRPRWAVTSSKATVANVAENSTDYKWDWLDAYLTAIGTGDITMTYGIQNFQWGPAESASPSNPVFRESVNNRDLLFATIGRHILRFNYSPSGNWNFISMFELSESGAEQAVVDETFQPTGLVKSEMSWGGGAQYFGLVIGGRQSGQLTLGEYANFEIVEDFSVYFDMGHERGSRAWYPVRDAVTGVVTMERDKLKSDQILTFAVLGARYNFERGTDLRIELISQEGGYTTEQMQWRWQALSAQTLPQLGLLQTNGRRLARSGLEFNGQQYALLSIREPNFWSKKDWSLYFRTVASLKDRSGLFYLASESALGDHGTLYFSVGTSFGADDSDLRGFNNGNFVAGVKLNW